MPKGVPLKTGQAQVRVERSIPPAPPEVPITLERLNASESRVIHSQLEMVGSEVRQRLIDESPSLVETLFALAKGIKVQTIDSQGDEIVYTIPPSAWALRYLTTWARLILDTDPAPSQNRHGIDKETREFLEKFIRPQLARPSLPEIQNGTFVLGTAKEVVEQVPYGDSDPDEPPTDD